MNETMRPLMRVSSIDLFRIIAVAGVVLGHTKPLARYDSTVGKYIFILLNQGHRFAVPFFFIIAGYFLGKKISGGVDVGDAFKKSATRLLSLLVFWSVVYLLLMFDVWALVTGDVAGFVQTLSDRWSVLWRFPVKRLFEGGMYHLWFLVALLWSLAVVTAAWRLGIRNGVIFIALGLYVFGLLAGPYATTPVGVQIDFNTRYGPFFGTIFVVSGWMLSRYEGTYSLRLAVLIFLAGFALHMTEAFALSHWYRVWPARHDYLIGTLPFGIGFAMIALARPSFGKDSVFARWGIYALGIYVVHPLIMIIVGPVVAMMTAPWRDIIHPPLVFLLALATTVLFSRYRLLRRYFV